MRTFITYLLLLFTFTDSCAQSQQNGNDSSKSSLIDYKQNRDYFNFNGPIKSSYFYFSYLADSLYYFKNLEFLHQDIMLYNRDIGGGIYYEFNRDGKINYANRRYTKLADLRKQPLEKKYAVHFNYDSLDIVKKSKLKTQYFPYPAYNSYTVAKPNRTTIDSDGEGIEKYHDIYIYSEDSTKRILEEKLYFFKDSEKKQIDDKHLEYTNKYIYDKYGLLVRQDIKVGPNVPHYIQELYIMDKVTSYCDDMHLSYKYDDKKRISKVSLMCGDVVKRSETYTYHPTKNYIMKNEMYMRNAFVNRTNLTDLTIRYYDENGNIIQRDFVKTEGVRNLRGANESILPEHTYYKYEFDKYHNWIKCYVYMKGEDGPVTAIMERELKYYDEPTVNTNK